VNATISRSGEGVDSKGEIKNLLTALAGVSQSRTIHSNGALRVDPVGNSLCQLLKVRPARLTRDAVEHQYLGALSLCTLTEVQTPNDDPLLNWLAVAIRGCSTRERVPFGPGGKQASM
jgi:hypothetical protein